MHLAIKIATSKNTGNIIAMFVCHLPDENGLGITYKMKCRR